MSQEPALTDEESNEGGTLPEGSQEFGDCAFDLILELIEELFHRIQFRAIGGELKEIKCTRDGMGAKLLMEPSAVPNDDMVGLFVAFGQLAQEELADSKTYRWAKEELAGVFPVDSRAA